jgi:hypothetical protein
MKRPARAASALSSRKDWRPRAGSTWQRTCASRSLEPITACLVPGGTTTSPSSGRSVRLSFPSWNVISPSTTDQRSSCRGWKWGGSFPPGSSQVSTMRFSPSGWKE